MDGQSVSILKTLWERERDGRWAISAMEGLTLKPQASSDPKFFRFENQIARIKPLPANTGLPNPLPPHSLHTKRARFRISNYLHPLPLGA